MAGLSLPDLRRTWNEINTWVAPWWAECSKEAFNTGLASLRRRWATGTPHVPVPARAAGWAGPGPRGSTAAGRPGSPPARSGRPRLPARGVATAGPLRTHDHRLARRGRLALRRSCPQPSPRPPAGGSARSRSRSNAPWPSGAHAESRSDRRRGHRHQAPGGAVHRRVGAQPGTVQGGVEETRQGPCRAARRIGPYDPATRRKRTASNRWQRAQDTVAAARHRRGCSRRLVAPIHHRLAQQFTTVVGSRTCTWPGWSATVARPGSDRAPPRRRCAGTLATRPSL